MVKENALDPIDRAQNSLAALRAAGSLIGQIGQPETNGSDLAQLLYLIEENLEGAIEDIHQESLKSRTM